MRLLVIVLSLYSTISFSQDAKSKDYYMTPLEALRNALEVSILKCNMRKQAILEVLNQLYLHEDSYRKEARTFIGENHFNGARSFQYDGTFENIEDVSISFSFTDQKIQKDSKTHKLLSLKIFSYEEYFYSRFDSKGRYRYTTTTKVPTEQLNIHCKRQVKL